MRTIFHVLGGIAGLIFLVILEVGLSYLLPYPFSKINLVFAILITLMLWRRSGMIVWLAFFASFVTELFAASPFGLVLFGGTISMLLGYWFYQNIFTNRSWFASLALTAITLFFYHFLYVVGLVLLFVGDWVKYIPWQQILRTFLWEEVFTLILVGILYFLFSYFSKEFRSAVIEAQRFKI